MSDSLLLQEAIRYRQALRDLIEEARKAAVIIEDGSLIKLELLESIQNAEEVLRGC